MKNNSIKSLFVVLLATGNSSVSAQSLYYVGNNLNESMPLKWVVGSSLSYDDNIAAGAVGAEKESSYGISPYVGLTFFNKSPQTTWDVSARLGGIYYFEEPEAIGTEQWNNQSSLMVNYTFRYSERLRFVSTNLIRREVQPDYSYGYASALTSGEYTFLHTDQAVGWRWSERFGTYTGFRVNNNTYENGTENDRLTLELYNQLRYQLDPSSVLTGDYRYGETSGDGNASGYTDHYLLAGIERRFSPTAVGNFRLGAQLHQADRNSVDTTSPYAELAFNSTVNQQFALRSFLRYGIEANDTGQIFLDGISAQFDDRRTLRLGASFTYSFSSMLSLLGGLDYVPTWYQEGRNTVSGASVEDGSENLFNGYLGLSVKFNDYLTGSLSYNFTNSDSDFLGTNYSRSRVNIGLSSEF